MKDVLNFKGHFKIEAIDAKNNSTVIDTWQDDNLIMETARLSMAELFAMLTTNVGINKIVLGTKGFNGDVRIPKTSSQGFVNTRDRLFSETIEAPEAGLISTLRLGDVIHFTGTSTF